MFLRDPWYWPEIWYVNPEIENPHLIYPGDVLRLDYVDGKPRVTLEQAGTVRLSPEVRSQPLKDAIRAIPYDLLMDFVGRPTLLDSDQVRSAPYVVGMRDQHILGSTANEIYASGLGQPAAGSRYNVVNVGDELRDPDDGDLLGYMGHWAGVGEVIQTSGAVVPGARSVSRMTREEELTHLRVLETGREIMQGDKLFPALVDVGDDFRLAVPENEGMLGQVIAVVDGVSVAGKYQVLAINRGQRDGLAARQRARRVLSRRGDSRPLRPPGLVGLHRELPTGAPAGRAQRDRARVPGARPHELRAGDAVHAGDPDRRLRRAPALRPQRHGVRRCSCAEGAGHFPRDHG